MIDLSQDSDAVCQQPEETALRHPLFQIPGPTSTLACLDAIDQAAYAVELFCHLEFGQDGAGGLSPKAQSGYFWLSTMLHNTLLYASGRLGKLHRDQAQQVRKENRYLSALLTALPTLSDDVRNKLLNAVATEVEATRSEVDQFVQTATRKN